MREMNKKEWDTASLGITYQMTLDAFLQDGYRGNSYQSQNYDLSLRKLKEMKQYRGWEKKKMIAHEALMICRDCIEAYLALGLYSRDIFETLKIYKEGMELATMNLGRDYFRQPISDFYEMGETRVFFHMKFAYACALYEVGYMRRAQAQFQDILSLNPSDVFGVRYYLYAGFLYFEEFEKFRQLYERYPKQDTFTLFANFLYYYKKQLLNEALALIPAMQEYNIYLYEVMSYERMNTAVIKKKFMAGSSEEAAYCYAILQKVTNQLEYLPTFLEKEKYRDTIRG